jgi:hypothetical protein
MRRDLVLPALAGALLIGAAGCRVATVACPNGGSCVPCNDDTDCILGERCGGGTCSVAPRVDDAGTLAEPPPNPRDAGKVGGGTDAGFPVEAGVPEDAGPFLDAGLLDAGPVRDGGGGLDGGTPGGPPTTAIARPIAIDGWDFGTSADIAEPLLDTTTYVEFSGGDGNQRATVSISLGALAIAPAGTCTLRFTESHSVEGQAPEGGLRTSYIRDFTIAGYEVFNRIEATKDSWTTRTYTFDASQLNAGDVTVSMVIEDDDNHGVAIAWLELEYPLP